MRGEAFKAAHLNWSEVDQRYKNILKAIEERRFLNRLDVLSAVGADAEKAAREAYNAAADQQREVEEDYRLWLEANPTPKAAKGEGEG